MRRMIAFNLVVLFFLFGGIVVAGTIYTWTDADGVKRYSNAQPPEDTENVQTIREVQYDQRGEDRSRQEYNRMVEDASRKADRHFKEQARKKDQQAEVRQQRQQEEKDQQIDAERARLLKELETIQKRGYSSTFTKGMKESLIKEVQDKLDRLAGHSVE